MIIQQLKQIMPDYDVHQAQNEVALQGGDVFGEIFAKTRFSTSEKHSEASVQFDDSQRRQERVERYQDDYRHRDQLERDRDEHRIQASSRKETNRTERPEATGHLERNDAAEDATKSREGSAGEVMNKNENSERAAETKTDKVSREEHGEIKGKDSGTVPENETAVNAADEGSENSGPEMTQPTLQGVEMKVAAETVSQSLSMEQPAETASQTGVVAEKAESQPAGTQNAQVMPGQQAEQVMSDGQVAQSVQTAQVIAAPRPSVNAPMPHHVRNGTHDASTQNPLTQVQNGKEAEAVNIAESFKPVMQSRLSGDEQSTAQQQQQSPQNSQGRVELPGQMMAAESDVSDMTVTQQKNPSSRVVSENTTSMNQAMAVAPANMGVDPALTATAPKNTGQNLSPDMAAQAAYRQPAARMVDAQLTSASQKMSGGDTVDMQQNIDKIVKAATTTIKRGESSMQLRLDPPELGTLRVEIRQTADGISLQFQATSEKAHNLLQQHSQQLRAALEAQGFQMNQIDVQVRLDPRGTMSQDHDGGANYAQSDAQDGQTGEQFQQEFNKNESGTEYNAPETWNDYSESGDQPRTESERVTEEQNPVGQHDQWQELSFASLDVTV